MIDTSCGLCCATCSFREPFSCGGCAATKGHPFHGECSIAICCLSKGYTHCGECKAIPCEKLFTYSFLDPVHGDKPQGARVKVCRKWAAESGKQAWDKVLLTSAGWLNMAGEVKVNIQQRFLDMLDKPAGEAKVLFIPTAAIFDEAIKMVGKCREELLYSGILPENITVYNIGDPMTLEQAMEYDCIYFTGGNNGHLLQRIKETGFMRIIKSMVYANKVYVGVSAGTLIATPNIGEPFNEATSGLAFIHAYISVHSHEGTAARTDLPLPHIPLTDDQALVVKWDGYEIIE
ncbi:MAG: Type 1 glutamine amidotransferase-like domain-containing protein [Thermoclostridium sp.]|nr:Type 1 glutamine amidotransferase-like domain-containing protein [Thermoclostridium sp.]